MGRDEKSDARQAEQQDKMNETKEETLTHLRGGCAMEDPWGENTKEN